MASEPNSSKRRYDLSMSMRTRKPKPITENLPNQNGCDEEGNYANDAHRPSLKELMKDPTGGVEEQVMLRSIPNPPCHSTQPESAMKVCCGTGNVDITTNGGNSIGQKHVEEEEKPHDMQLAHVEEEEKPHDMQLATTEGIKVTGIVSRYVKVLNHMIKARRDSKKKRNVFRLLK